MVDNVYVWLLNNVYRCLCLVVIFECHDYVCALNDGR